ncbi:MAG: DUF5398 family protein [Parachlamydiaceae bacterium]|nr:DUF5398 family protein [Parachlamydiaceae bacterium]
MFGLENQKKKKPETFVFDLETTLKDQKKHRETKQKVEERIQKIKTILKSGDNKEDFDKIGVLLHGYTSLLKVMARCLTAK